MTAGALDAPQALTRAMDLHRAGDLAAAENAAPGQALRLGSARRQLGNDPRGAAGVVGTASGIALKTATDRMLKGR